MAEHSDPPTGPKTSRWRGVLAGSVGLLLLVIVLLPMGIGYGIKRGLMAAGADTVRLENVDFNPFSATLMVEGLAVRSGTAPPLRLRRLWVDLDWLPLIQKRAWLPSVQVEGLSLSTTVSPEGEVVVSGLVPPPSTDPPPAETDPEAGAAPWGIGIGDLRCSDIRVDYHLPDLDGTALVERLSLAHLASWQPERPAQLAVVATVQGSPLTVDASLLPFAPEPGIRGTVTLTGLSLAPFAPLAEQAVSALGGTVDLEMTVDARQALDGTLAVDQRGTIQLTGLTATVEGIHIAPHDLHWSGTVNASVPATGAPDVKSKGDLSVAGLAATAPKAGLALFAAKRIKLEQLRLTGTDRIHLKRLTVDGITMLSVLNETDPPVLSVGQLAVADVQVRDQSSIKVATVEWADMVASVRRMASGELYAINLLDRLDQPDQPDQATRRDRAGPSAQTDPARPRPESPDPRSSPSAPAPESAMQVRVGEISLTGKSGVRFVDEAVPTPFSLAFDIETARIDTLDSGQPNHPSPFVLAGGIGAYTDLTLKGTVAPFAEPPTLTLAGKLTALDLPPLSSYTVDLLGYRLDSGALDTDLTVKVEKGVIEGNTKLAINQLVLAAASEDKMGQLTRELTMPLDAALSLLRDKNDNIRLEIPLNGTVDDPDFEIGKVVNQALGRAMRKGAFSYLKLALQPYGTILTVAQMAAGAATAIRLEPVAFAPGSAQPTPEQDDYFTKLAGLLADRKGLTVRLCGQAVNADRPVLAARLAAETRAGVAQNAQETAVPAAEAPLAEAVTDKALNALAKARAMAVKSLLVNGHGVAAARLFVCHPAIDPDEKAAPRVALEIG